MTLALTSGEYPYIGKALEKRGIEVLYTRTLIALPTPVRFHADMQYCHLGGARILSGCRSWLFDRMFEKRGMTVLQSAQTPGCTYPDDAPLNVAFLGERLIANPKSMDDIIKREAQKRKLRLIPVRQGYTRCSVCVVSESAVITADKGVAVAARLAGLDVLQISADGIELPGYPYGLIGGCAGLVSKQKLVFTGNVLKHPDGHAMVRFAEKHAVEVECLDNRTLLDVGGILALEEQK